ncbi:MAG: M23 family metallopeptidase [Spirochaetales bacterium]|nr:M23 family metallopeptidase [Spirochaetales bacterium]
MQTLIKEQHVIPRQKIGGLRERAAEVREHFSSASGNSSSRTQPEWSFLKHDLNPQPNLVFQANFERQLHPLARAIEYTTSQVFSTSQVPFLLAILYSLLLLFSLFLNSGTLLPSLTKGSPLVSIGLSFDSDSQSLRSYATFQGDQGVSFGEFQDVDGNKFIAMTTQEYTVAPGDTLSDIADQFDLNMDTIISFNAIPDVRRMQIGQTLTIPSRDGLRYTVRSGDSLASIAAAKGTTVNALLDANGLTTDVVAVGSALFIPEARMSSLDLAFAIGEVFAYPTVGRFTSGFGFRSDPFTGQRRFHNGLDLANSIGTPIRASMAGRVVHIESQVGNYGKFIIVQHARGYQTLYAHLDSFAVSIGQYVVQGQVIGRMGHTGRSTGPHLHFSIIENGNFVDPRRFLR